MEVGSGHFWLSWSFSGLGKGNGAQGVGAELPQEIIDGYFCPELLLSLSSVLTAVLIGFGFGCSRT